MLLSEFERREVTEEERSENVNIADITFSYNNGKLISALKTRGNEIALQRFDRVQKLDAQINQLFVDFESLTRPVSAFITFEEEDVVSMALGHK